MMKRFATLLLVLCMLAAPVCRPARAQAAPATTTTRLAALARLWGDIKYFDPQLAYRNVDWDAALVTAIPKVEAATTTPAYSAAVQSMLDVLHDPATAVVGAPATWKPGASTTFASLKPLGSGSVLVTLDVNASLASSDALNEAAMLASGLAKYQTVIFDLRAPA
ncbi:MAG: hypothetical protein ACHQY2_07845, partial [Candidatus Eremiobacterales bacterium]